MRWLEWLLFNQHWCRWFALLIVELMVNVIVHQIKVLLNLTQSGWIFALILVICHVISIWVPRIIHINILWWSVRKSRILLTSQIIRPVSPQRCTLRIWCPRVISAFAASSLLWLSLIVCWWNQVLVEVVAIGCCFVLDLIMVDTAIFLRHQRILASTPLPVARIVVGTVQVCALSLVWNALIAASSSELAILLTFL